MKGGRKEGEEEGREYVIALDETNPTIITIPSLPPFLLTSFLPSLRNKDKNCYHC